MYAAFCLWIWRQAKQRHLLTKNLNSEARNSVLLHFLNKSINAKMLVAESSAVGTVVHLQRTIM